MLRSPRHRLRLVGAPPPLRAAALAPLVEEHSSVERVVRWGYAQNPMIEIADIVRQDEFTHDLIVPVEDDLVLVYDST